MAVNHARLRPVYKDLNKINKLYMNDWKKSAAFTFVCKVFRHFCTYKGQAEVVFAPDLVDMTLIRLLQYPMRSRQTLLCESILFHHPHSKLYAGGEYEHLQFVIPHKHHDPKQHPKAVPV